jgi:hypothetical protein
MTGFSGGSGHSHGGHGLGVGTMGFAHGVHDLNFFGGQHAGEVTFDAIIVGHSFTSVSATPHIDSSVSGHGVEGVPGGTMEGNGPSFDVPINSRRTNYGILVVGLGNCDWESKARAALTKLGLAECFNLQPPNPLLSPPRHFDRILPINFTNPAVAVANPVWPKGHYQGATGSTTIWRTNWEIGERSAVGALFGHKATRKVGVRTYLEVELTVWFYAESGDYEIRVVVRAIGGNNQAELMDHLTAARGFCKVMLKVLQATPPSRDAREWRERAFAASQK